MLITVNPNDRDFILDTARKFKALGFTILATEGTGKFMSEHGIDSRFICKINEGRPNILDAIKNGEVDLVINTPIGKASATDDSYIRKNAIRHGIPYITTAAAAAAAADGIAAYHGNDGGVKSLQEYHNF